MIDLCEASEELVDLAKTATTIAAECDARSARDVLQSFARAGLLGAGADEAVGGLGLPITFDTAIIDAAAAKVIEDPVLEALLAARYCPDERLIQSIIEGEVIAAIAPVSDLTLVETRDGLTIDGRVAGVPFAAVADILITPVRLITGEAIAVIDLSAAGVTRQPAEGFDARFSSAHIAMRGFIASPASLGKRSNVEAFREDYHLFVARWLLKQAETCLDLTVDFVSNRRQFGRALASFQSVRFTLAAIGKELRSLALLASPQASGADRAMAYAYAATIVPPAIEKCMHLHGGMGYTEEVSLHLYLRRARARLFANGGLDLRRGITEAVLSSAATSSLR